LCSIVSSNNAGHILRKAIELNTRKKQEQLDKLQNYMNRNLVRREEIDQIKEDMQRSNMNTSRLKKLLSAQSLSALSTFTSEEIKDDLARERQVFTALLEKMKKLQTGTKATNKEIQQTQTKVAELDQLLSGLQEKRQKSDLLPSAKNTQEELKAVNKSIDNLQAEERRLRSNLLEVLEFLPSTSSHYASLVSLMENTDDNIIKQAEKLLTHRNPSVYKERLEQAESQLRSLHDNAERVVSKCSKAAEACAACTKQLAALQEQAKPYHNQVVHCNQQLEAKSYELRRHFQTFLERSDQNLSCGQLVLDHSNFELKVEGVPDRIMG
jgi:chromosome segregation ATPase